MDKELVIQKMQSVINFIKEGRKIDKTLNTLGIDICFGDLPIVLEFQNSYVSLIWKIILETRGVEELSEEEFDFFDELFYDVAYGLRPGWDAEKIYNYFTDVGQIIRDFDIGVKEEL